MARRSRRWLRILLGLVVVLVALLVALAAATQTAWFRRWVTEQVVVRASASMRGDLAIGTLEGDLVSGLVLRDVRLTLDGRPVAAIARAEATYDLWTILMGDLGLDVLRLEGVELSLRERDGVWNVAHAFEPVTPAAEEDEEAPVAFAIDAFAIEDARLRIARAGERWAVRRARIAGSLATGPDGAEVRLDAASFQLARRKLEVRTLAGTLTAAANGAVAVRELRLETGASRLTGEAAFDPEGQVDVDLEAALAAAELRSLLGGDEPEADLRADIEARGPAATVAVDATVAAGDARLALAGTLDLAADALGYDLTMRVRDLDLAAVLGPTRPVTDVNGTLRIEGSGTTLEAMAAEVALALDETRIAGETLAGADVEAAVADGAVRLDGTLRAAAGSARVQGNVALAAERYDLTVTADGIDPAVLLGDPSLRGRLDGTLTARGTGFTPAEAEAEATLALAPSRIGELTIQSARAEVRADDGRLVVPAFTVESSALAAEASGELALAEEVATSTGRLRFDVAVRDLGALGAIAGVPDAAGSLTLAGTASGSLEALTIDADVRGRALAYGENRIGTLAATVTGSRIGEPGGQATVNGRAEEVRAGGQAFARADVEGTWQQTGAETSTARASLTARDPEGRESTLVARAAVGPRETRVEVERLALALGDETWRAEGAPVITIGPNGVATSGIALRSDRGVVRVEGSARTAGASDLRVEVRELDLAGLEELVGQVAEERGITGTLSLDATLTGTLAAPRLVVDGAIADPEVAGVPYAEATVRLEARPDRARVEARLVQAAGRALTLAGGAPVALSLSPFELRLTGDLAGTLAAERIDLAFLGALTPALEDVGGTLDADVTLAGRPERLLLRGPLTIANGRATVPAIGLTYDAIEVTLRLDGQAASVERLYLASGDGALEGSGSVRLGASGPELDVRIALTRFPLFRNEYGRGAASGWLWSSGTLQAPVIEGSLETAGLVLQIPERLPGQVRPPDPTIEVVGPGAPAAEVRPAAAAETPDDADPEAEGPGLFENAAITVQLQVPRDAWIRRSDAEIELRGWMTAWKKPAEELQLSGEIEAVRGWFAFQGKNFDVAEGRVIFTGAGLDPNLDLTARHRAGEYTVRLIVRGTLTKPTLALESDPTLSQADVLSVLLFGKPASELSSGESAGLREQALGVAAGYAASELRQSVARALGVDTLEFSGGGLDQAEIAAGKYVAEDVFVSLSHRFGEAVEELRIQYFLTPRWTIETSTDTLGRSGLDVFWKRRY